MRIEQVNQVECTAVEASLSPWAPRRAVVWLSTAARGSALWAVIAAGLATRAGTARRAAMRGMTAVAAASAAGHVLGGLLGHRRRPRAEHLPARQALPEHPDSSSFPSAHATAAAAFTTALWLEHAVLGAAVAPLAVVVAYGRVRTRVHWPTDVAAGAALGVATALLTRRIPLLSPE
ncbi:phosphatase PAP2 family protein [Amycolatopsis sp. NPDC051071]|uniref:phosphatase PAP2 family protein n=1 Tax=Amycolatopsis sp. NPDC051071 TaxID=3154637 RepID=UPI00342B85A3